MENFKKHVKYHLQNLQNKKEFKNDLQKIVNQKKIEIDIQFLNDEITKEYRKKQLNHLNNCIEEGYIY